MKITSLCTVALLGLCCNILAQTKLNFLSEYVLKDSLNFRNTIIGGLSGIDYHKKNYYFIVDDAEHPRVLVARIKIKNQTIKGLKFKTIITFNKSKSEFIKNSALDLESILVDDDDHILLVSEGSVKNNKLPLVFKIDQKGNFIQNFQLPKNLSNIKNIKHNAAFEASSKAIDSKSFWVAMEGVLKTDGVAVKSQKRNSPIRITFFDAKTSNATKQFAYQLDPITKPLKGTINLNGVTAILEHKKNHFLVVERTYQNGYGAYGNTVKIFEAIIDENSTDILAIDALTKTPYTPVHKRLLFNFDTVKNLLTAGIVDNIEGITFGPILPNGNQSLLLVSDDNFQVYGKQLNQIVLLEIIK